MYIHDAGLHETEDLGQVVAYQNSVGQFLSKLLGSFQRRDDGQNALFIRGYLNSSQKVLEWHVGYWYCAVNVVQVKSDPRIPHHNILVSSLFGQASRLTVSKIALVLIRQENLGFYHGSKKVYWTGTPFSFLFSVCIFSCSCEFGDSSYLAKCLGLSPGLSLRE